ncbi:MAG: aminoacetone oxidase family FAD-binding enzyme, partial [Clostridiales bacterium]|nr:aminoacetone oxidase family FAD-binding enzyme [Clostridiales bacterium]
KPVSALCPIILKEDVTQIEGLSLKNVTVKVTCGKKEFSQFGEMLFTHNGVSGPCVLTLSSLINRIDGDKVLSIDLKPALSFVELDKRILRDFEQNVNKDFRNSLDDLLPKSLIPYIVNRCGIQPNKKVNLISKEERSALVGLLKNLTFTVNRLDNIEVAIVTSGGVQLKEVNPKTMESKLVGGLYIVGELLDVDALTGGYNLQIAWSTAFAAANHLRKMV